MMIHLLPLYDRVIVRPSKKEESTASGIALVHRKEAMPDQGTVLAVGPKVEGVGAGDEVIFHAEGGTTFDYSGDRLVLLPQDALDAVVSP
jgi:chaperonin GroES